MTQSRSRATAPDASEPGATGAAQPALELLRELELCLQAEMTALSSGAIEPLIAAADRQRELLEALEKHARGSLRGLLDAGSRSGSGADAERDVLLASLERCRNLNEAAGAAIASARRGNENALRLLGFTPDPPTYESGGEPARVRGRDLGVC